MDARVSTGDAVDVLVDQFRVWLAEERGLSRATVCCHGKQARMFLRSCRSHWIPSGTVRFGQATSLVLDYCRGRNTW